jgi:hypothetical protein
MFCRDGNVFETAIVKIMDPEMNPEYITTNT